MPAPGPLVALQPLPASLASAGAGIAGCPAGLLEKFARLSSTVLYVHLDRGSGTWCEEQAGVLTPAQAREIVGHTNVTVRPVLDLAADLSYTGYVAPPNLKEQLALLNGGYCTFPHCHRKARAGDVDHQLPARQGGATVSSNTHRLCRKHHRTKDQGRWRLTRPAPGLWIWASPAGAIYLVSNGVTTHLNGIFTTAARANRSRTGQHEDPPGTGTAAREPWSAMPDGNVRRGVKNWSPTWDPWDDIDPLTQDEHEHTYGLINTG